MHGFAADDVTPDLSIGSDLTTDADVLYVDGNTWYRRQYDQETRTSVETRGWYMCSQQPEHPNEHLFWKVILGEPDGALGVSTCDVLETDVVLPAGQNRILMAWYKQLGGSVAPQVGYCRIGSEEEFLGRPCNDPFE